MDPEKPEYKTGLMRELLRRRVFQITGIYFGAIFGVMEFTDMIVQRYNLSDVTIDIVLAAMLSMLPAVVILAWGFGAPGKDAWGRTEKITLPVNLVFALGIVFSLSVTQDVESVVEKVESVDANGQTIVRDIPKQKYVNRLQIFFLDPSRSVSEQANWLSYAVPEILKIELEQNPFIVPFTLYRHGSNGIFWRVKRAGFEDGLNIPLSLAKSIAGDSNSDFFVRGDIDVVAGNYQVNAQIFNSKTGRSVDTLFFVNSDLYALTYELAEALKVSMQVQSTGDSMTSYLPAAERLTEDFDSFQSFISGVNSFVFNNDFELAKKHLSEALHEDPSFAYSRIYLASILEEQGQFSQAKSQLQQSLDYAYKLTEQMRFEAQARLHFLNGNRTEERRVYEVWSELHPNSVGPKNALAMNHLYFGNEIDEAIEYFEASLSTDPNQTWVYQQLGVLHEVQDRLDQARYYYQEYAQRDQSSYEPQAALARIALTIGDFEQAREYLRKAMYLRTDMVTPMLLMADLELREGNLDLAQMRHNDAFVIAKAPRQISSVYAQQIDWFMQQGQNQRAFETLRKFQSTLSEYEDPINAMFKAKISYMYLYVDANKADLALLELNALKETLQAPFDDLLSIGYVFYYLALEDTDSARLYLGTMEEQMRSQNMAHVFHILYFAKGLLEYIEANYSAASAYFIQSNKAFHQSVNSVESNQVNELLSYYLIRSLRLNGKPSEAREHAHKILLQRPYYALINVELAHLEHNEGNISAATEALNKALAMWQEADEGFTPKEEALSLQASLMESN
ncbi:tetratricopeptide repeat protein [Ningiella sp. W23]|uniref:tetratricopeptide repeat protein n=1 Tax=Ningiella sp. W23 TaxID=3023715 RepID=UPI00375663F8